MKNAANWFEIPATDISRARKFYENILQIEMTERQLANGLSMALFPVEEGGVGGALCCHPQAYFPETKGSLIYLNANPDMGLILKRIEEAGGQILVPKTRISEEYGSMALFIDCEGNRVALHSNE